LVIFYFFFQRNKYINIKIKTIIAIIASFDSKISKCNFKNTNIDCFDVGTCIITDDDGNQNQYNTCPKEVIVKLKNNGNKKKKML